MVWTGQARVVRAGCSLLEHCSGGLALPVSGLFAPWTFRPIGNSPHRRLTHRRFTPCTWGETSMDNLALQQTFHPMGNLPIDVSVGRNIHKRSAPRPWGKTSYGRRGGFRHVQHVRPNRGPHKKWAPTRGPAKFCNIATCRK